MAYVDDLKAARDNIAARLKEVTASTKPTYDIDGQRVSWNEYQRMLLDQIAKLDNAIENAEGPYVEDVQAYTMPPYGATPGY